MSGIAGARVLVTGGARGLGRLLGYAIGRLGGIPVLWDLDDGALADAADEIERATHDRPATYVCDVTDQEQVAEVAEKVRADGGDIDILVNNAGVVGGAPLLEMSEEQIRRTLEVNTLSLFWTTREFLPAMIDQNRGHIVTIASAAGWVGVPRQTDYAASKFGAVGFDEALRLELKRTAQGVKTTVVCPYYISTGMFDGVETRFDWLLPIMEPKKVVTRIVDAIQRDKRRLFLPPVVGLVPTLRALPADLFDRAMDVLGVTAGMDHFRGRS
ncbi:MAG: SDR family oxidoreductase [Nitriliruptorales bacterium]|nr:SDR family oxidoreductase [Nitriliruptorales bacterium]